MKRKKSIGRVRNRLDLQYNPAMMMMISIWRPVFGQMPRVGGVGR